MTRDSGVSGLVEDQKKTKPHAYLDPEIKLDLQNATRRRYQSSNACPVSWAMGYAKISRAILAGRLRDDML
jgi:hypothetical protein